MYPAVADCSESLAQVFVGARGSEHALKAARSGGSAMLDARARCVCYGVGPFGASVSLVTTGPPSRAHGVRGGNRTEYVANRRQCAYSAALYTTRFSR